MKYIICLFLLLSSLSADSQSNFVNGYYLSMSGDTIRGYIDNKDWSVSPSKFNFRKSLNEDEVEVSVKDALMFALVNNEIYLSRKFYYKEVPEITFFKKDEMKKYDSLIGNVFIRVLVKGKLSLLKFVSQTITTHYLIASKEKEELLVYEKYRLYSDSTASASIYEVENKQYQLQLKKVMGDQQQLFPKIDLLDYADKQLVKIVSLYNQVGGGKSENLINRSDKMKLYVRPAIGFPVSSAPGIKNLFSASVGIELVLPRNFESLVFYADVGYRSFVASTVSTNLFGIDTFKIEQINSVLVRAGIRKYFLNSRNIRPYIYGGGHLWYSDRKDVRNYFAGIGFSYKKRFEIDASYNNRIHKIDARNKYHFFLLTIAYRIPVRIYSSSN